MAPERDAPRPGPTGTVARWRRPARAAFLALALLVAAWAGAHAVADRGAVRSRLRARAAEVLRARLGRVELGESASVDWLFRATVGPVVVPASAPGAPPVVRVDRVKVRAALPALLAGRLEPASIRLYGVRLAPGPEWRELVALAERLRGEAAPARAGGPAPAAPRASSPVVHLRGFTVDPGGGRPPLGPFDGRIERRAGEREVVVEATLSLPGGGRVEARLRRPAGAGAPRGAWAASAEVEAGPDDLPEAWRAGPVRATAGRLALAVEAEGGPNAGRASVRGALRGLVLAGPALGPEPVGPLSPEGQAQLSWSLREARVTLSRAVAALAGPLRVEASGALTAAGDLPFELSLRVPPVDYRALVEALPPAVAPPAAAPRPEGPVGGRLALSGALRRPADWAVDGDLDLDGLREAARRAPPSPLRAPFTAHPDGEDGPGVVVGPGNPAFVPITELPVHVIRAVTVSEDAGFFAHRGFDFEELRNAAAAGARAGQLGRGGSTITQQLAKNLYLSRDRTLARKAREALVTVALEGTLPKARLLEIYLNLIEWGPGLHGIGAAARRYFDEDARALTPRQACFLAAIIPSPVRSHAAVAAGRPASLWSARIDDLLVKLHATGVLDDAQLAEALAAPLAFGPLAPPAPPAAGPPGDGRGPEGDGAAPVDDGALPGDEGAPPAPGGAARDDAASGG
jgi:hypothetical protein